MLLEITVVAGPGAGLSPATFPPTELSITWPSEAPRTNCSGLALQQALAQRWPGCSYTVAGRPLQAMQAGKVPLVNGAVVVAWLNSPAHEATANQGTRVGVTSHDAQLGSGSTYALDGDIAAVLAVCSGPGAGAVFALHRGSYSLGRGPCRIQVADPSLSRRHGTLVVGAQEITLSASVGSSGFSLRHRTAPASAGAEPIKGTVVLEVGHVVTCGSSTLELRFHDPALPFSGFGTQLLDSSELQPLSVPSPAGSPRNRAAMAVAGCLPLILGLVLAILTGSWMFLAFATMGAAAVLVPLFTGLKRRRTFRVAVEDAVQQDCDRRRRTFPDAGTLMITARFPPSLPRFEPPGAQRSLRLGTCAQAAAVAVTPADPGFCAPQLPALPLCVPLAAAPVTISGHPGAVMSLLNYVLMQLDAAAVPVVLLGPAGSVPLAARFLPHTCLTSSASAAAHALADLRRGAGEGISPHPAVLLLLDQPVQPWLRLEPGLRAVHFSVRTHAVTATATGTATGTAMRSTSGTAAGSVVGASARPALLSTSAGSESSTVELRADANRLVGRVAGQEFVPDGVPSTVFDSYARSRALVAAGAAEEPLEGWDNPAGQDGTDGYAPFQRVAAPGSLMSTVLPPNSLPPPELCTADSLVAQWKLSEGGPLLPIPLGQSSAGPTMFDFRHDGPHLLLGGTTGSGKSELLRTLIGSLAAVHSPADLQFVFIDFKGGAGLGGLCKLPHTTSLITDLGGDGMDRTLASLRAELHHREAALAVFETSDSDSYRESAQHRAPMAGQRHQRGHGMAHLVVVIDEFRVLVDQYPDAMAELMRIAAVGRSLGIHLIMATQRPQGALNADIRANVTSSICLRVQSSFDSTDVIGTGVAATISATTPGRAYISKAGAPPQEFQSATLRIPAANTILVPTVEDTRARMAAPSTVAAGVVPLASDVGALTHLMVQAWQRSGGAEPDRRAAPAVVAKELPAELDLELDATGDHQSLLLGLVDVPQRQCVEPLLWNPELTSHLACVGTTAESSSALVLAVGQILAANHDSGAPGDSLPRLVYLLDGDGSLGSFATSPWVGGYMRPNQLRTTAHLIRRLGQSAGTSERTLILCISDWGRWATAFRRSPWHETEHGIAGLIRFSQPHVVAVVGGGHELMSAPFLPAIPNRLFLPFGASSEATMLWPRLPRFTSIPGRCAIAGAVNSAVSAPGAGSMHIAQLGKAQPRPHSAQCADGAAGPGSAAAGTLYVPGLPESISMAQLKEAISAEPRALGSQGSGGKSMVVGLGGDGHEPVRIVLAPGTVLPVLGNPGSGKSSFLQALAQVNGNSTDVNRHLDDVTGMLWLDDAASLTSEQLQQASERLANGLVLVVAFSWPGPALSALPLAWGLRTAEQGIVIRPQRSADGELFGVRLDTAAAEPLGRGVLLDRGVLSWFQFPLPEKRLQNLVA